MSESVSVTVTVVEDGMLRHWTGGMIGKVGGWVDGWLIG